MNGLKLNIMNTIKREQFESLHSKRGIPVCISLTTRETFSIDPLGFHNFSVGMDSVKCKYDDSKADKKGERVSPKNIYANPLNPIWFALIFHLAVGSLSARELLERMTHCFSVLGSPVLLPSGTAMGYQNV